jgi:hypothetical protein
MKSVRLLLGITLFIPLLSCNSQPSKKEVITSEVASDKIEAYYFHFTARCVTCLTIEAEAKKNLETLFPNQVKQGLITFQAVNLDEESSKPLAERLGVSGQTLLLVKGDQKINLTNEGFLYAVVKPDKFKEIINEKIDGLMIK